MSESYYELLDVEPDASTEEIEQAYRETVKHVHPDKSDNPDARETFIRVQEARTILTDPEQRAQYDREHTTTDAQTGARNGQNKNETHQRQHQQQHQHHQHHQHQQQQRQRRRSQDETGGTEQHDTARRSWRQTGRQSAVEARWLGWAETHSDSLSTAWEWLRALFTIGYQSGNRLLRIVRTPSTLFVDRAHLRALITSPAGIPLCAAITLVIVLTIGAHYLGYAPRSSSIGFPIVITGLVVSYTSYELFSSPKAGRWAQRQFKPAGRQRLWPIAAANLLGVGLVVIALLGGAPYGGLTFTGVLLLPFCIPLLYYNGVLPVFPTVLRKVGVPGAGVSIPNSHRYLSAGATVVVVVVLFTRWGIHTPSLLAGEVLTSSTPWFLPLMLGPVYVGLVLNFLVGVVMYACLLWSMYAMGRYLLTAPWTDRYDHGYRIRPAPWNLLLSGPFVVFGWMVFAGVPAIQLPLGIATISLTQADFLVGLFFLPSVLTGLYLLRRQLEPKLQHRNGSRP